MIEKTFCRWDGGAAGLVKRTRDFLLYGGAAIFQIGHAESDETVLDAQQRIAGHPFGELAAALDADIAIETRAHVATPTEGAAFNELCAFAGARAFDGIAGDNVNSFYIVAVHALAGYAVKRTGAIQIIEHAALAPVHVTGIEIVLANKQHRQFVKSGEIQRFVHVPFFQSAVSEKRNGHGSAARGFRGKGRAHGERNRPSHDGHRAEDAALARDQVHGSAPPFRATRGTAENLCE